MNTKSIVKHAFTAIAASVVLAAASMQSAQAAGPTSYQQFWDDLMKAPSPESVQASGERHQEPRNYQDSWYSITKAPTPESVQASGERYQDPVPYQTFWDNLAKAPSVQSVQASGQSNPSRMYLSGQHP
ncbi:MAG TPA: hypothetical protein VN989_07905 [Casimicrobiaceae bacterium]|jgi:hypothetical protein|nr:hypothetical protein [Casimicrobiaceae bacterium]